MVNFFVFVFNPSKFGEIYCGPDPPWSLVVHEWFTIERSFRKKIQDCENTKITSCIIIITNLLPTFRPLSRIGTLATFHDRRLHRHQASTRFLKEPCAGQTFNNKLWVIRIFKKIWTISTCIWRIYESCKPLEFCSMWSFEPLMTLIPLCLQRQRGRRRGNPCLRKPTWVRNLDRCDMVISGWGGGVGFWGWTFCFNKWWRRWHMVPSVQ